ncbi:ATP phosphoribosyltransferase regulatory subunit [Ruminiclostridium cellulolyticum]|uniref:ATP phosphoribosyltransferase regulatory subunit n=1 Tax=Ruminiclostridium cellulolyticum (strain ATCC 35319 / DSM 5812 / JCM 6584 / H10) TaxID=394503 RepID=HISZ_RUMCH|nr:ATP phosphoribosyltransferase regulatory subunit [Ruminiclostridium cellulolyticum]B8I5U8.1 RecName: Full=ATP phosphoribosyltransferase regulatory subunit [Ruminiclostridium cellulolyticum H10]ACL74765.1 histidyl-tRNA synthetase 2 [Ruminiclostridium cellulolyticum H10]
MSRWKIYTPDGVQDILFDECYKKREIEKRIRNTFRSYGYYEIETPTIEFFDVFSSEIEHFPQESMVKFFDQKGRILVLRPDITVPVARITATKNRDVQVPIKYSYIGNVFRFNEVGGGRQNEFTQAGVEMLGDSSSESDAEIIAMAINTLKSVGLKEFKIEIGQVEFFKGLAEEAGFSNEDIDAISKQIDKKDLVGVEEILNRYDISTELREIVLKLTGLFGSVDVIKEFKKASINGRSLKAIENVEEVVSILCDYGLSEYVSIDLGMLKSLNYDTGITFRGFTNGVGFPILSGARYDNLTSSFGKECPATGFSLRINMLMTAMEKAGHTFERPSVDSLVCYEKTNRKRAIEIAEALRKQDMKIETFVLTKGIDQAKKYAASKKIGGIIYIRDNDKITVYDIKNNITEETSFDTLLNNQ